MLEPVHPVRAPTGEALIPSAPPPKRHPYDQWSPDARALDLVGDKWTLLIVRDLAGGPRRFVELQRVLPGISTEQLRSRLNRMVADGLLTRQRYREVPPRVDYELTERSKELLPVLGALARWGYDWTWSSPRTGEDVNVGAIFRLAPGLLTPSRDTHGSVELVVTAEGDQPELRFRLSASDGHAVIDERSLDGRSDATVSGSRSDWVRALGPEGSLHELDIRGDSALAEELLGGFVRAAQNRAAVRAA
jgi:DNA-binding HxlR family transcriptional regulator